MNLLDIDYLWHWLKIIRFLWKFKNHESSQQLIEENNTNPNINTDTPTPYKDDDNFDERFAKLEEENNTIKSDKKSLENEINSLRKTM